MAAFPLGWLAPSRPVAAPAPKPNSSCCFNGMNIGNLLAAIPDPIGSGDSEAAIRFVLSTMRSPSNPRNGQGTEVPIRRKLAKLRSI